MKLDYGCFEIYIHDRIQFGFVFSALPDRISHDGSALDDFDASAS